MCIRDRHTAARLRGRAVRLRSLRGGAPGPPGPPGRGGAARCRGGGAARRGRARGGRAGRPAPGQRRGRERHRDRRRDPGQRAPRGARLQRTAPGRTRLPRAGNPAPGRRGEGGQDGPPRLRALAGELLGHRPLRQRRRPPDHRRGRPGDRRAHLGRRRRGTRRQAAQRADPVGPGQGPRRHLRQAADPALRRVPAPALAHRGDQRHLDLHGQP